MSELNRDELISDLKNKVTLEIEVKRIEEESILIKSFLQYVIDNLNNQNLFLYYKKEEFEIIEMRRTVLVDFLGVTDLSPYIKNMDYRDIFPIIKNDLSSDFEITEDSTKIYIKFQRAVEV